MMHWFLRDASWAARIYGAILCLVSEEMGKDEGVHLGSNWKGWSK